MIVLTRFPAYASGNCDFVTKRTKLNKGDKVVALDVQAEQLPSGMLCLHSSTVKQIVAKLGWELADAEEIKELRRQNELLNARAESLTRIVSQVKEQVA